MLRKIVLCIAVVSGSFCEASFSSARMFLDIGITGSISKTKESNKCYDIGLKSDQSKNIFLKDDSGTLHVCSESCSVNGQKLNNKEAYGARFGIYKQVDKFFAVGLDFFSEWYNVDYKDDQGYKFQCTGEDCQKVVEYTSYKMDNKGTLTPIPDKQKHRCSDIFNSQRFSCCNPFFKRSKRHQIGGLVSVKLYTSSKDSFIKLGIGIGQLKRRIPVAIPHKTCAVANCGCGVSTDPTKPLQEKCTNEATLQHNFKIENVSSKKGLAFGIALGTRVSNNIFVGIDFLSQQNKNKANTETYKNREFGVAVSMELGK